MPRASQYPSVHAQMFRLAVAARRRGLTFEEFWHEALRPRWCSVCEGETLLSRCPACGRRCSGGAIITTIDTAPPEAVRFPTDTADKRAAIAALETTREGWKRAYENTPPLPREHALVLLGPELRVTPEQVRTLFHGQQLPDGLGRGNDPAAAVA